MEPTETTPPQSPQAQNPEPATAPPGTVAETHAKLNESIKISIMIPTNAYFMSGLRDFTMNVVQNMTGFSEQWAFRFQSVVDELVNNAIEFGSAPGEEVKITFVSNQGKSIEIFVEDKGTGSSKKTAQEMAAHVEKHKQINPATLTSIRGRGLAQIVANWTDVLEFKDNPNGGLTVHVVKYIEKGEDLPANPGL